ncbi:hypothetical protein DSL72_005305 [Monilinia vaccinii-corymbosi]|uniref:Uncharacterized protein n=1 Tax=Monilinia vaccinii-corymbosi TaxID=61207 RepID=A0A8A3PFB0_9HELO|nr:hypothetical protein DSL72_005305 [Monilinia vaccinii-corymbosi]
MRINTTEYAISTFKLLHTQLLKIPAPLLPPASPHDPTLTSEIASLQLHSTLETALHILNLDLPSAHFLARHMQRHDDARAWYSDAKESEIYSKLWGEDGQTWKAWQEEHKIGGGTNSLDVGQKFLDAIQKFKEIRGKEREKVSLEEQSRVEINGVIE